MTTTLLALASTTAPDVVVVYPDRAQVTRQASVACGARAVTMFERVPPAAVQDSFRATVAEGTVDGLRAELVKQERVFGEKARALEARLEALGDEARGLDDQRARLDAQRALSARLLGVAELGLQKELAADRPDPKAWQTALEAPLATQLALAKAGAELGLKRRVLERTLADVRRQLDEVRAGAQQQTWRVEVLVSCPSGRATTLSLTYLVAGAGWTPAYEARAAEAAKAVELSTYATVTQVTGEDWQGVKLTLSTAVPSQNATPPAMTKLQLGALARQETKKVLTRRDEAVETVSAAPSVAMADTEAGLVARSQGVSVQLEVPEAAKVPGDGNPVRLFVGAAKLTAAFGLKVTPKLYPFAFRVAEVSNTGGWPLLPGVVDAFRAGGLVGRYPLERVAQGAAFSLTFGLEESLRVTRTVVEELKKETGVFDSKRRFTSAYRFELANYGKAPVEVTVADHLPVAEVNDLEVALSEKTTPGARVDKASGIVTWRVPLRPHEKRAVDFAFRVDVPASYDLGGL